MVARSVPLSCYFRVLDILSLDVFPFYWFVVTVLGISLFMLLVRLVSLFLESMCKMFIVFYACYLHASTTLKASVHIIAYFLGAHPYVVQLIDATVNQYLYSLSLLIVNSGKSFSQCISSLLRPVLF